MPDQTANVDTLASLADSDTSPNTNTQQSSQVKLNGRLLNFTRLTLNGDDVDDLLATVKAKLGKQTQSKLPVLIDCQNSLDLAQLWQGLWDLGLQPIGIVTGALDEQAKALNIAIFPADGNRIDGKGTKATLPTADQTTSESSHTPLQAVATDTATVIDSADHRLNLGNNSGSDDDSDNAPTSLDGDLVHNQILRSGQSINHVGGDLILTRGVNAGAEAITDYSLHVYGKAEGRLVAGATGDKNAKIFCLKFNPALVSVAGTYCLRENIPAELINQAVQVSYVDGQGLVFSLMA